MVYQNVLILFSLSLTLLIGCGAQKTDKAYSMYFVQTLNQLALSTEKYITSNADRIVHTNSPRANDIFQLFVTLDARANPVGSDFESSAALVKHRDSTTLLFGTDDTCSSLVVRNDNRVVCSKDLEEMFNNLLFSR